MSSFLSRTAAHERASAAVLLYNRFREGLKLDLNSLRDELLSIANALAEIVYEDNEFFEQSLRDMTYLNLLDLKRSEDDDFLDLFDDHDQESNAESPSTKDISADDLKTNLVLLEETVERILHMFDLERPVLSNEDYKADHRILADLVNAFGNTELDPLRQWSDSMQVDGESIVEDRPPLREVTNDERSFRLLFSRLVNTLVTRTQLAKVASAGSVLNALLTDDPSLSEKAATEYRLLLRLPVARSYSLFLGSLDGRMPEPPSSLFKL